MDFKQEIDQLQRERISSIYYQFSEGLNRLEKAELQESSFSNLSDFKFRKSGKEIGEKLGGMISHLEEQKISCLQSMASLVEKIGLPPEQGGSFSYYSKNWGITDTPLLYSYESYKDEVGTDSFKNKTAYNSLANQYVDICVDLAKLRTIFNNIDEKRSYTLNSNLATKLGF